MEAKDLRIGNYVKTSKGFNKIKNFYEQGCHFGFGYCQKYNQLEPIPLTEEILLKCGFEKWVDGIYYIKITVGAHVHKLRVFHNIGHLFLDHDKRISVDCKYLHELQNFHYILTGKELEINL